MKKTISMVLVLAMVAAMCFSALVLEVHGAANLVGKSCDTVGYTIAGGAEVMIRDSQADLYLVDNPMSCASGAWASVYLRGWVGYDYAIDTFGYKIDGGAFVAGDFSQPTEDPVKGAGGEHASRFKVVVPVVSLDIGEHTLTACVKLENDEIFEIWAADITISEGSPSDPPTGAVLSASSADTVGYSPDGETEVVVIDGGAGDYLIGNPLSCESGEWAYVYLRGWAGYNFAFETFGYKIDGGAFVAGDFAQDTEVPVKEFGGVNASRFKVLIPVASLTVGNHTIAACAKLANDEIVAIWSTVITIAAQAEEVATSCDTVGYTPADGVEVTIKDGEAGAYIRETPLSYDYGAWKSVYLRGWTGYNYAIDTFGYKIDGGAFVAGDFAQDTEDGVKGAGGEYASRFKVVIPVASLAEGEHTIAACVKLANGNVFEVWSAGITVKPPAQLNNYSCDTVGYTPVDGAEVTIQDGGAKDYLATHPLSCNYATWTSVYLRGWVGYDKAITTFGYKIDGGAFVAGAFTEPTEDGVRAAGGEYASRFKVVIPVAALEEGNHTIAACAKLANGEIVEVWAADITITIIPADLIGASCDTVGYTPADGAEVILKDGGAVDYLAVNPLSFEYGEWESVYLRGWAGYNFAFETFGYKIDGGAFVAGDFSQPTEDPVKGAGGMNASRFKVVIPVASLEVGVYEIAVYARLANGETVEIWTTTLTVNPPAELIAYSCDTVGYTHIAGFDITYKDGEAKAYIEMYPLNYSYGTWESVYLRGWVGYNYAIETFGYKIDGGEFVTGDFAQATEDPVKGAGGEYASRFRVVIPVASLEIGEHTIAAYAELTNGDVIEVWTAALTVNPPPTELIGYSCNEVGYTPADGAEVTLKTADAETYLDANPLGCDCGTWKSVYLRGWAGYNNIIETFGYKIDGGAFIAGDFAEATENAVRGVGGEHASRFKVVIPVASLEIGVHTIAVYAELANGDIVEIWTTELKVDGPAELIASSFDTVGYTSADGFETRHNNPDGMAKDYLELHPLSSAYGTWTSVYLRGWAGYNYAIDTFGYKIDGGEFVAGDFSQATEDAVKGIAGASASRFKVVIPVASLAEGEHTVAAYVKLANDEIVEIWTADITISKAPEEDVPVETKLAASSFDTVGYTPAEGSEVTLKDGVADAYLAANPLSCEHGAWASVFMRGWVGYNFAIETFGYKIDGGEFVAGEFTEATEDGVKAAGGANASRFKVIIPVASLAEGEHTIAVYVKLSNDDIVEVWATDITIGKTPDDDDPTEAKLVATAFDTVGYTPAEGDEVTLKDGDAKAYLAANPLSCEHGAWASVYLRGWTGYDKAITTFGYKIDGGEFVAGDFAQATEDAVKLAANGGANASRFKVVIPVASLAEGEHEVAVYVKLANDEIVEVWAADITIGKAPDDDDPTEAKLIGASCDTVGYTPADGGEVTLKDGEAKAYLAENPLSCGYGAWTSVFLRGWTGYDKAITTFGYKIDGGEFVAGDFAQATEDAVKLAGNGGANASRFKVVIPVASLAEGEHEVTVCVKLANDEIVEVWAADITISKAPDDDDPIEAKLIGASCDTVGYTPVDGDEATLKDGEAKAYLAENPLSCDYGSCASVFLRGWAGYNYAIETFGYKIDGGEFVAGDFAQATEGPVKGAGGEHASRFKVVIPVATLKAGAHTITACVKLVNGDIFEIWAADITIKALPAALKASSCDTVGYTPVDGDEATLKDGDAKAYLAENPLSCDYGSCASVFLRGWTGYDYAIETFGYKIDGGEFVAGDFAQATEGPVKGAGGEYASRFKVVIPVATLNAGKHTIAACAKLANGEIVEIWATDITIKALPAELKASSCDTVGYTPVGGSEVILKDGEAKAYLAENPLSCPYGSCTSVFLRGWAGYNYAIETFGYKIDGGEFVAGEFAQATEDPVKGAGGEHASRFKVVIPVATLMAGKHTVAACAKLANGEIVEVWVAEFTVGAATIPAETHGGYVDAVKTAIGDTEVDKPDDNTFDAGEYDTITQAGWFGANYPIDQFGYRINGSEPIYGDWAQDVDASDPVRADEHGGDLAKRYNIPANIANLPAGSYKITYLARLADGSVLEVNAIEIEITEQAITPPDTGSVTAIIAAVAVIAMGSAIVISKKRISER